MSALLFYTPTILFLGGIVGLPIYFLTRYFRFREREVRALEGRTIATELGTLMSKNAELQDRIEQLEAIVTSTDFELIRKIHGAKQSPNLPAIPPLDAEQKR